MNEPPEQHSEPPEQPPERPEERAASPERPAGQLLTELDAAVLRFEKRGHAGPGAKEKAVREELELSPTRYYQILNALLDQPAALAAEPVLINRLRRLRDARRERR